MRHRYRWGLYDGYVNKRESERERRRREGERVCVSVTCLLSNVAMWTFPVAPFPIRGPNSNLFSISISSSVFCWSLIIMKMSSWRVQQEGGGWEDDRTHCGVRSPQCIFTADCILSFAQISLRCACFPRDLQSPLSLFLPRQQGTPTDGNFRQIKKIWAKNPNIFKKKIHEKNIKVK